MELKSAWEIALQKHQEHERLSAVTDQLLEHVRLLEEGWDSIHPRPDERLDADPDPGSFHHRELPRAA